MFDWSIQLIKQRTLKFILTLSGLFRSPPLSSQALFPVESSVKRISFLQFCRVHSCYNYAQSVCLYVRVRSRPRCNLLQVIQLPSCPCCCCCCKEWFEGQPKASTRQNFCPPFVCPHHPQPSPLLANSSSARTESNSLLKQRTHHPASQPASQRASTDTMAFVERQKRF